MGLAPVLAGAAHTAAYTHALLRAEGGFTVDQLVSEYRALRASVLSGWLDACLPDPPYSVDMLRFNEAIDKALAESVTSYATHVDRARKLLLGMFSHDLRSPLQTIQMSARVLQQSHPNTNVSEVADRQMRSCVRMQKLLDDMIDFNRAELGLGIQVSPRSVDLGLLCEEELQQIRTTYDERPLKLEVTGDCRGRWDPGRIQQLLNNLVVNAIHYGEPEEAIYVAVRGGQADVRLAVANSGETLDGALLSSLFQPMHRGERAAAKHDSGLGLGLYIASEIAKAHGGKIVADSRDRQTVFTVSLPKGIADDN